jgi:hypothetical protein
MWAYWQIDDLARKPTQQPELMKPDLIFHLFSKQHDRPLVNPELGLLDGLDRGIVDVLRLASSGRSTRRGTDDGVGSTVSWRRRDGFIDSRAGSFLG